MPLGGFGSGFNSRRSMIFHLILIHFYLLALGLWVVVVQIDTLEIFLVI